MDEINLRLSRPKLLTWLTNQTGIDAANIYVTKGVAKSAINRMLKASGLPERGLELNLSEGQDDLWVVELHRNRGSERTTQFDEACRLIASTFGASK